MLVYSKRGQLTIFIILGVLVVAGVVLAVVLTGDSEDSEESDDAPGSQNVQNPSAFLKSCSNDQVFNYLKQLREQGGSLDPASSLKASGVSFLTEDVSYLCFSNSLNSQCTVQVPSVVSKMEQEMQKAVTPTINQCLLDLKETYSQKGYNVSGGDFNESRGLEANFENDRLYLEMDVSSMNLNRKNETIELEGISELYFVTDLYNLGSAANYIVGQESQVEDYDSEEFALFYPEYEVVKNKTINNTELYRVSERGSDNEFKFAVRELV